MKKNILNLILLVALVIAGVQPIAFAEKSKDVNSADVVILVDFSGSITSDPRYPAAENKALENLVNVDWPIGSNIAIIAFGAADSRNQGKPSVYPMCPSDSSPLRSVDLIENWINDCTSVIGTSPVGPNTDHNKAIKYAVENPRDIDQFLVEAYLARRILDHLIGFKVSPLLWRHVPRAKSAGRVQSPTLRMICTREDEIDAFCPEEFWPIKVDFKAEDCTFGSDLIIHKGEDLKKVPITTEVEALNLKHEIENSNFTIKEIKEKEVSYSPKAPFRTSTLQQAASSKLFFNPERTMQVAQSLYESGLITYMRTDGIGISAEIINEIRGLISAEFGEDYLPDSPKIYKSKAANAQEAHEPIRPTDIRNKPENTD